ncbi:MAG: hypothetical protein DRP06_03570 [Candidatus Aenigmatarchaeota archaeon]|nr:MAG: hypothetical protein DRP06_03570 [Candidatus Aenigmarchaeota archaeon]
MRGMIFLIDVIIGISILVVVLLSSYYLFSIPEIHEEIEYEQMNLLSNDFLNSIAEIKVYEAANQSETINNLMTNNNLTEDELELSVLDLILTYWSIYKDENNLLKKEIAENITEEITNSISTLDDLEFSLIIGNESISGNHSNISISLSVSSLIENTYGSGPKYGYIARAYLNGVKTNKSRYLYFGGFVGQGNLNFNLNIPETAGTITSAYIEVYSGSNFSLYLNGNFSGNFSIDNSTGNFTANIKSANINLSNFIKGNNTIEINFSSSNITEQYFGGGFLKVDYNSTKLYEEKEAGKMKYYFPGIEGIMNLYDGFYVNGILNNMSAYIHYKNNISGGIVYLTIANSTVFRSNETGDINVTLDNLNLSHYFNNSGLNCSELNMKTIPLKFGIENIIPSDGEGYGDAVLITDVSGSMGSTDIQPGDQQRLAVAILADKNFIAGMLNMSGNRVGLVSFTTNVHQTHELSDNKTTLDNQVDTYTPLSGTCICCGINKGNKLLQSPYMISPITAKSAWLYNTNYSSTAPPEINGSNWTDLNYNDTNWSLGNAILGFENMSYPPNIDTDIGNNRGNYYFRKYFNITNSNKIKNLYINILSDDNTEVYLNGRLVYNETKEHNATYWNVGNLFFENGFEDSSFVGKGFNATIWSVEYGTDNNEARTHQTAVDIYEGVWGAEMEEGDENEVAISTRAGFLDLTNCINCNLTFKIKLTTNWENADKIYVDIYDGVWHYGEININGENYDDGIWHEFSLNLSDYNLTNNFRIRFDQEASRDSEESHWDNIIIKDLININKSYLRTGSNVLSVKLKNNDDKSAKFDLKLEAEIERKNAMLVMSDGGTNYECLEQPATPDHSGNVPDNRRCSSAADDACDDAIQAACEARNIYNTTVYSVAFGSNAETITLKKIACWDCNANDWLSGENETNCSRFYQSNNADELEDIYLKIANDIVNLSFEKQILVIEGNISYDNHLYRDSYLEFNYNETKPDFGYGEFYLSFEKDCVNSKCILEKKPETQVLEVKVTSYSADYWTNKLILTNSTPENMTLYDLSKYGLYENLGDPFILDIPINKISEGSNNISIFMGVSSRDMISGGNDSKLIYSLKVPGSVDYNDIFNSSYNAEEDAKQRLKESIYNITGQNISILTSTDTNVIKGVRTLSDANLVKFVIGKK